MWVHGMFSPWTSAEQRYLDELHAIHDAPWHGSDAQMVATGHDMCERLRQGKAQAARDGLAFNPTAMMQAWLPDGPGGRRVRLSTSPSTTCALTSSRSRSERVRGDFPLAAVFLLGDDFRRSFLHLANLVPATTAEIGPAVRDVLFPASQSGHLHDHVCGQPSV
jgi:Protein of unknown function (DUF732)